jgi:hypothetical protein
MRNSVSFYKHYRQRRELSSGWKWFTRLVLVVLTGVFVQPVGWAAGARGFPDRQGTRFRVPGTAAPGLARLFTPRHAPSGAYEVVVLDGGIEQARDTVLTLLRDGSWSAAAAGTPPVRELDPLEAFGEAGSYDRTTVARLYTGRKARVVRVPVEKDGRAVAAVTLVSPYPDPSLSRLEEGTMLILLHVDRTR